MKLIMRHKEEKELLHWYFDDQTPVLEPSGTNDPVEIRFRGQCASSTTGKLFIYGGATVTKNIKMSNISKHN